MNAEDLNFNIAGVDILMRHLARVKSDGFQPACAEELWQDVSKSFEQDASSRGPFTAQSELLQSLEECKISMTVLDQVREHLGKRIRFLRRAVTPFLLENGIKTMPDEVLSLVFEAGHRMTKGWDFGKLVSQTSKRFRQVSLRTPLLWTRISEAYSESQIQAFLSRSGQLDLEISTSLPYDSPTSPPDVLFKNLRLSSGRWSHLNLFVDGTDVSMRTLDLSDFPRLKSLYSHYHIDIRHWKAPLLARIHGNYANGAPITKFESQLTSFELLVKDVSLDVDNLASTLHSMPNLKHLSLEIDSCEEIFFPTTRGGRDSTREPHSVHIETLRISIKNSATSYVVAQLYDALSYFSASTIEITLSCLTNANLTTFFYDHGGAFFPYGSTISITVLGAGDEDSWDQKNYLLWEIVENCEIAHTIHIDNLDAPLVPCAPLKPWHNFSHYWRDFCNLRHLRVRHCSKFTEPVLKALVSNLMTKEAGHSLQSLDIIACPHISKELFLNLRDEVGPRLNWKPHW